MPSVDDYASLAPFTLDELVGAANAVLRNNPALQVAARTVRYYISQGLLQGPSGGPKFARYSLEHLRRIVAIRQWLDQGLSLEDSGERIRRGEHGGESDEAIAYRYDMRISERPPAIPLAQQAAPVIPPPSPSQSGRPEVGSTVRRIRLTQSSVLEVSGSGDLFAELSEAAEAARTIADSLRRK